MVAADTKQKGGTFLRVEKQGTHYMAVFRGLRDTYQMDMATLRKRVAVLKGYGMDTSEGEKALTCLEEASK